MNLSKEDFLTKLPASTELFKKAKNVIPGGVNSPVRAFNAVGGVPAFIDHGNGCFLFDVDGNKYVDLVCSWGPMIHGHAHPFIVEKVREVLSNGLSFGAPTSKEIELAEEIISRVGPVEQIRLVNSGTEATMSVIRLARAVTNRSKIIKFAGCYHGHVDSLLVQAGSGVATFGIASTPGIPEGITEDTIVVEYNDIEAVEKVFELYSDQIAAVIVEAAAGNMGAIAPLPGFNQNLRDLTNKYGSLLIMDEVMTGFRVSYSGWWGLENVDADLFTFGKVMSGGLPAAAFGGKKEYMQHMAPIGNVYQAGTLSGNPVAVTAGLANLQLADQDVYRILDKNSKTVGSILSSALTKHSVNHKLQYAGNLFSIFFVDENTNKNIENFTMAKNSLTSLFPIYFHTLLQNGVYAPPSAFEAWFVSTAINDEALEILEKAADKAAYSVANQRKENQ